MRRLALCLAVLTLLTPDRPLPAADWAWILSIPHARSTEHLYKVRVLEIDGKPQRELIRYAVPPGSHVVKVRLLLDVEWEPELAEAPRGPGVKELSFAAEEGKTYQLAAQVDEDAPIEAQLDRTYWEPLVYRVD